MGYDIQFASNEQLRKCRLTCIQLNKLTTLGAPQPTWPLHSTVSRRKRLIFVRCIRWKFVVKLLPGLRGFAAQLSEFKKTSNLQPALIEIEDALVPGFFVEQHTNDHTLLLKGDVEPS